MHTGFNAAKFMDVAASSAVDVFVLPAEHIRAAQGHGGVYTLAPLIVWK
jgi:hypothetical protein